ncbi:MAG TPA: hypothetical protein VHY91_22845 [Pirellulales bacterium]|nr:hypothetical protein [Pirellulales bacterium]
MIRYSILITQPRLDSELARQFVELRRVLDLLVLPYEVICIDHSSSTAIARWLGPYASTRVLTLAGPCRPQAAVAAAFAAARGQLVINIGSASEYPLWQIPHLIAELDGNDVVFARRRLVGWPHAWRRLIGRAQRWLFGVEVPSTDGLFWAARREAVAGIDLASMTPRSLPRLLAVRGLRVSGVCLRLGPEIRPGEHASSQRGELGAVLAVPALPSDFRLPRSGPSWQGGQLSGRKNPQSLFCTDLALEPANKAI